MQAQHVRFCGTRLAGDIPQRTIRRRKTHCIAVCRIRALLQWRNSESDYQYPISAHEIIVGERVPPRVGLDKITTKKIHLYLGNRKQCSERQSTLQRFSFIGLVL